MQIKRFRAHDMAEALRLVKKEFGCHAVILSAKEIKNGSGILGFLKGPFVEVTAATDAAYSEHKKENVSTDEKNTQKAEQARPVPIPQRAWNRQISLVKEEAGALEKRGNGDRRRKFSPRQKEMTMGLFDLSLELQKQGVKERIALDLIEEMNATLSKKSLFPPEDIRPSLIEGLRKMGAATKNLRIARGKQKRVALIGPTGVGKTTTIAKLAAIGGVREKRELGLITLDDKRIGAIAQLEVYARILDLQMEIASNREELSAALEKLKRKDIVLIDTPGISLKDSHTLNALKDLLDAVTPVEIHLLLSAVTKEKDFTRLIEKFSLIPIDSLIFTKLDESSEFGDLLNQLVRTKIPVSYFTNGPQVPGDMETATLEKLIDLILDDEKGIRFRRPLTSESVRNEEKAPPYEYGPYLKRSYA